MITEGKGGRREGGHAENKTIFRAGEYVKLIKSRGPLGRFPERVLFGAFFYFLIGPKSWIRVLTVPVARGFNF